MHQPLVSIMIPNRNHAKFLDQCIESALSQTYPNIEVIVLDNCSDDDSVSVARKYVAQGVRVCRNLENITGRSFDLLAKLSEGKYIQLLCADDYLDSGFVEAAVRVMEENPSVGFVHCDRNYVDELGAITELDPFFSCSFVAPGYTTQPIFLLTEIGLSSQCLMRKSTFHQALSFNTEFDHFNADKELWFRMSQYADYAYIRSIISYIRVHANRETASAFSSFYHPLSLYLTLCNQVEIMELNPSANLCSGHVERAFRKLADENLKIALNCLKSGDVPLARKYRDFALVACHDIIEDAKYSTVSGYIDDFLASGVPPVVPEEDGFFQLRKRSYAPPDEYVPLSI